MSVYGFRKPYCPPHPGGLKVVWIGTSLIRGATYNPQTELFEYRGGPRPTAFAALQAVEPTVDFIGHVLNSSESPPVTTAGTSHSGINSTHGTLWYSDYWDLLKGSWTGAHIFCIAVGANDGDSADQATDFSRLMDLAARDFPTSVCLFGTEICTETPGQLDAQAAQVRLEVAARKARGMNVELVDVHQDAGLSAGDWSDGLHLTDRGYAKVGAVWARALLRIVSP